LHCPPRLGVGNAQVLQLSSLANSPFNLTPLLL